MNDKPQNYGQPAWGFEQQVCSICKGVKGGNPYRLCKCQREERGILDGSQPHLKANLQTSKQACK